MDVKAVTPATDRFRIVAESFVSYPIAINWLGACLRSFEYQEAGQTLQNIGYTTWVKSLLDGPNNPASPFISFLLFCDRTKAASRCSPEFKEWIVQLDVQISRYGVPLVFGLLAGELERSPLFNDESFFFLKEAHRIFRLVEKE